MCEMFDKTLVWLTITISQLQLLFPSLVSFRVCLWPDKRRDFARTLTNQPTYRPLTNAHALRSPRSILSRCHRSSRPKLQLLDFFSIKPCRLLTFQVWVARFWSERRLIRRLQPLNSTESRYRISSRCCRLRDLISGCSCDAASIWLEATGSD